MSVALRRKKGHFWDNAPSYDSSIFVVHHNSIGMGLVIASKKTSGIIDDVDILVEG
jgi:hypothetical protein